MWIGATALAILIAVLQPFRHVSHYAEFYANPISCDFLLGIISYEVVKQMPRGVAIRLRLPSAAGCLVSVALLMSAGKIFTAPNQYGLFLIFTGITSFALVLSASILSEAGWDTRLRFPVLLGDASYVLYLVHPFCVLFISRVIGARFPKLSDDQPLGAVIGIVFSCVTAVVIHLWGERPVIRILNKTLGGKPATLAGQVPVAMAK